jgi:hypothetical protein
LQKIEKSTGNERRKNLKGYKKTNYLIIKLHIPQHPRCNLLVTLKFNNSKVLETKHADNFNVDYLKQQSTTTF